MAPNVEYPFFPISNAGIWSLNKIQLNINLLYSF